MWVLFLKAKGGDLSYSYTQYGLLIWVENQIRVAKMLNCKMGSLPMTYLGLPLIDKNLSSKDFEDPLSNMRNKLQPWKGKNLYFWGRLILTNSSLNSTWICLMGMFLLPEPNHQQMDAIRAKFFCRGDADKFKYHMVKWERVCVPKEGWVF